MPWPTLRTCEVSSALLYWEREGIHSELFGNRTSEAGVIPIILEAVSIQKQNKWRNNPLDKSTRWLDENSLFLWLFKTYLFTYVFTVQEQPRNNQGNSQWTVQPLKTFFPSLCCKRGAICSDYRTLPELWGKSKNHCDGVWIPTCPSGTQRKLGAVMLSLSA